MSNHHPGRHTAFEPPIRAAKILAGAPPISATVSAIKPIVVEAF